MRRGGSGGFETEETFQPGDETAGAFGLGCRREAVALFGARVTAGLARFKALTFATGLASGIAAGLCIHRVEFLGGIFLATGLAGAGLDAERRAIFTARARVARRSFPAGGRALGFGGREDVELGFFTADRGRRGCDDRGRGSDRGWSRGEHRSSRSWRGGFDGGRGGYRRDHGSFRLRRERVLVLALRGDDLEGAGFVIATTGGWGGVASGGSGAFFPTVEAGATGGAERTERLGLASGVGRGGCHGRGRGRRIIGSRRGGSAGRIWICHCVVFCVFWALTVKRERPGLVTLAERVKRTRRRRQRASIAPPTSWSNCKFGPPAGAYKSERGLASAEEHLQGRGHG